MERPPELAGERVLQFASLARCQPTGGVKGPNLAALLIVRTDAEPHCVYLYHCARTGTWSTTAGTRTWRRRCSKLTTTTGQLRSSRRSRPTGSRSARLRECAGMHLERRWPNRWSDTMPSETKPGAVGQHSGHSKRRRCIMNLVSSGKRSRSRASSGAIPRS